MSAVQFDQLIVNAAVSQGITSKPLTHCVHFGHKFG